MDWMLVEKVAFAIRRTHGVIVRPYGNMLVVAPLLVFTRDQVRQASLALVETVSELGVDGQLAAA
jgi:adenosylmethionine-8-amino-7-oxononanoate aminotransferase